MEHASTPPLPPEHGMPLEMRAGSGGGIAGPRGAKAERATKTKYLGYLDKNQILSERLISRPRATYF